MSFSKSFLRSLKTPQQIIKKKKLSDLFYIRLQNQETKFWMNFHKTSMQYNYTFIESAIEDLPSFMRYKLSEFNMNISQKKIIQKYIGSLQNQTDRLVQLSNTQFNRQVFEQNSIKQVSKRFIELKYLIQQEVQEYANKRSSIKRLVDLFILAGSCNVLQYQIWNKLMFQFIREVKQIDQQQKLLIYFILFHYLSKFMQPQDSFMRRNVFSKQSKFRFLSLNLQDLFDFNLFLRATYQEQLYKKKFNKSLHMNQQPETLISIQIIINRLNISKLTTGFLNISKQETRLQCYNIKKWFVQNIQLFTLNQCIKNYKTVSKILLFDQAQRQKIQGRIWHLIILRSKKLRYLSKQNYNFLKQDNSRLKLIIKLIDFWKQSGKYPSINQLGYIKPLIQTYLQTKSQPKKIFFNSRIQFIFFCLVSCGLQKDSLVTKIQHYVEANKLHKQRNYINALRYKKLKQNGLTFIQEELEKQINEERKKFSLYQPFNPTQQFWFSIIREVGFDQLKKYKNPFQILQQHYINKQFNIFGYEIDIILKYKGYYFACQISGSHILRLGDQSQAPLGKIKIRHAVLEACGINIIKISTANLQPKLHMRFKQKTEAKMYVIKLLNQKIKMIQENKKLQSSA